MLPINPISTLSDIADMAPAIPAAIPLEDKVKQLFAEYTTSVNQEKADILEKMNTVDPSDPAKLLELQNQVGNYSLILNMVSTLMHKSVSAIDTVLKAQ
ncbi:type III secretion system inner rod subunit SctI [Providencia rettgeri]|uniref:type III secretion system inner rod subunit SctI n=1 Tax=Providencia rettgeri TaxID=587 RepID=UPI0015EC4BFF|nr:type III secretion system inner rod subunit SctI [Providencia rettgeri]QLR05004.1 type III secretion system inner rod subunit SctI [Providencia rettgeri]